MRNALIAVLCCAGVVTSATRSDANAATVARVNSTSAYAATAGDIVRQLNHISDELGRVNGKLDAINAAFVEPPDPEKPPVAAALADLRTQADQLLRTVAEMEAKLTR